MASNNDYYGVLGLAPSADERLIRAACRALPAVIDTTEQPATANAVNEACAVLRDAGLRCEYDAGRGGGVQQAEPVFSRPEPAGGVSYEDEAWAIAAEYHPGMLEWEQRLRRIFYPLAVSYRAYLLDSQQFSRYVEIGDRMEREFLQAYFGADPLIVEYARDLLVAGERESAIDLNKVVRVLGSSVPGSRVVETLERKLREARQPARPRPETEGASGGQWWWSDLSDTAHILGVIFFAFLLIAVLSYFLG
ncbi:MAG: hypothetical protein LJE84_07195 [Gammaproteobacteria bacterium]|jgi:hypothetical protein|nr:hypothetical protein [Gammaproteobacteria bacterium]